MNKRSLQWSRSPFTVRTVEAMPSCVTGMLPTGNRSIAVMPVGVAAARILLQMPIQKLAARRSCMPLKNEAVCVASRAPLGSLAQPSPVGSKKGVQLPPLPTTLLAPDPEDPISTVLELDERMARLCSKKPTTGPFCPHDPLVFQVG